MRRGYIRLEPLGGAEHFRTASLWRRFCPRGGGYELNSEEWRTFAGRIVPGKGEDDFTRADWLMLRRVMRETLAGFPKGYPRGMEIDPDPYSVWFAGVNGCPAK